MENVQALLVPYLPPLSPAHVKRSLSCEDSVCNTGPMAVKREIKEEVFTDDDILRCLKNATAIVDDAECLLANEIRNNNEAVQESSIVVFIGDELGQNQEESNIEESNIEESNIEESNIEESNIEENNIGENNIEEHKLEEDKLEEAKLEEAKLEEAKLEEAKLEEDKLEELERDEELVQMLQDLRNTCPVCQHNFRHPSRMRRHLAIHTSERNFKCTVCQAGFKSLSALQSHGLSHREVKPFNCSMCPSTQCTKSALQKHIERNHGFREKRAMCNVCGKSFMEKRYLMKHSLRHSGKNVLCTVCGHMFYTEKDLRIHVAKTHDLTSNDTPEVYQCLHCNRTYTYKPHLANHMLHVHLKVRQYECSVCDKTFAVKAQIQRHLEYHSNMKFFCKCGRNFTSKPSLDRHSRTHMNYRPYTCAMCGLTFTQKSSIQRHIVTNMKQEHFKRTGKCRPLSGRGYYTFQRC